MKQNRKSAKSKVLSGLGALLLAAVPALGVHYQLSARLQQVQKEQQEYHGVLADHKERIDEHTETLDQYLEWFDEGEEVDRRLTNWVRHLWRHAPRKDGRYDDDARLIDHQKDGLENLANSVYQIVTRPVREEGKPDTGLELRGVGTVMVGRYLFTVNHVCDIEGNDRIPGFLKEGMVSEQTFLLHREQEIPIKKVYHDADHDIAVFALPKELQVTSWPYALGDSDELKVGNLVYLIGAPGLRGINTREGIVSQTLPVPGFPDGEHLLYVSAPINPGDSGSLVVAVRDGKYEVIGFPKGKFLREESMGFIIGVTPYMKSVLDALTQDKEKQEEFKDLYDHLKSRYG